MHNLKTKQHGFSLVEIMVSISLFAIVITVALGAVLTIVDTNRKAQYLASVMNDLNFALESVTRSIKTGSGYDEFFPRDGDNYSGKNPAPDDCTHGCSQLYFLDSGNVVTAYKFDSSTKSIMKRVDNNDNRVEDGPDDWISVTTPGDVQIEYGKFYVSGDASADGLQPKILMVIKGKVGSQERLQTEFNLQTTVSQRKLELDSVISN